MKAANSQPAADPLPVQTQTQPTNSPPKESSSTTTTPPQTVPTTESDSLAGTVTQTTEPTPTSTKSLGEPPQKFVYFDNISATQATATPNSRIDIVAVGMILEDLNH